MYMQCRLGNSDSWLLQLCRPPFQYAITQEKHLPPRALQQKLAGSSTRILPGSPDGIICCSLLSSILSSYHRKNNPSITNGVKLLAEVVREYHIYLKFISLFFPFFLHSNCSFVFWKWMQKGERGRAAFHSSHFSLLHYFMLYYLGSSNISSRLHVLCPGSDWQKTLTMNQQKRDAPASIWIISSFWLLILLFTFLSFHVATGELQ